MNAVTLAAALLSTGAMIGLGAWLRLVLRYSEAFWRDLERLAYTVLLPALFIGNLAVADFGDAPIGRMIAVLAASSLGAAVVTWALRPVLAPARLPGSGPAFTSVFQGAVRFNNYVGLVLAGAAYGAQGVALAALANAILVPLVNLTSTLMLVRYGDSGGERTGLVRPLVTNPLILACVIGVGLHLLAGPTAGLFDPAPLATLVATGSTILKQLGAAALPVGLLCVGAGLRTDVEWGSELRYVAGSSLIRFAALPLATYGLCRAFGLSGATATVAVLFQCLPTASSAYVLARRLGGDARLMATIIAAQTIAAGAVLPVWLTVARTL